MEKSIITTKISKENAAVQKLASSIFLILLPPYSPIISFVVAAVFDSEALPLKLKKRYQYYF
jgi:hypothetical protein